MNLPFGCEIKCGVAKCKKETGDWRLETGDWRLETGDWRLETGDWRLETVKTSLLFLISILTFLVFLGKRLQNNTRRCDKPPFLPEIR
jgi:hypothetical protein